MNIHNTINPESINQTFGVEKEKLTNTFKSISYHNYQINLTVSTKRVLFSGGI